MSWTAIVILIAAAATAFDYIVIRALTSMCWGRLPEAFPARPPREDALRKPFQSFRFGLCNFGLCIHVPARLLRWLGAPPASIPWEAIRLTGQPRRGWLTAQVGGRTLMGPQWCLELAGP